MTGAPRATGSRRVPGTSTIARAAAVILVVTLLARVLGFVRYLVFGATVGGGDVGTAYASANLLPTVLFEIVAGGALAGCVIPLVAGLIENDRDGRGVDRASRIVSALLGWTLLITVPIAVAVSLAAAPLAEVLLDANVVDRGTVQLGARMLRIFAPQVPLYGITVLLGAFLQARRRFLWPALAPLVSSLVVIAAYGLYAALAPTVATARTIPASAEAALAWGTTAGVLAMALPLLVPARRAGLRLVPSLALPTGTGRRALALGGAGLGAVLAQQGATALILVLAARAGGVGTLPVFQYAQAVYLLPFALLVVPIATSVMPHLAELRLIGDRETFGRLTATSMRAVIAVSAAGAAALFGAAPAIEAFFRQLDRAGVIGVGAAVAALALGLVPYAVTTLSTRVLSAALRARDALAVGAIGWVIAGVLIVMLVVPAGTRRTSEAAVAFGLSIALGMTVSAIVGLLRVAELLRTPAMRRALVRGALASMLAMAVGSVAGYAVCRALLTASTDLAMSVTIGALAGLLAVALSTGILIVADRSLLGDLRRARRSRHEPAAQRERADATA